VSGKYYILFASSILVDKKLSVKESLIFAGPGVEPGL